MKGIAIPSNLKKGIVYKKVSRVVFKNDSTTRGMLFVAIHEQILQPIEIQPIEMAEVVLRSRQVAAASSNDLCSQVAPLDWRRPTQCLWTLCIKRRAIRPPLQPKRAVCAPTFNRLDRVAGGSRSTGCNDPPDQCLQTLGWSAPVECRDLVAQIVARTSSNLSRPQRNLGHFDCLDFIIK